MGKYTYHKCARRRFRRMLEAPKLLQEVRENCILALTKETKADLKGQLRTQLEEVEALLTRAEKAHSLLTTGPEC
jgi:hypothetical protein